MSSERKSFETMDEYMLSLPLNVQEKMQKIRKIVHEVAPQATEGISYQMPTFKINGKYFFYFAGWKEHVSIYPVPNAGGELGKELEKYASAKGTLKFLLKDPIPYDLIRKIVEFKLKEVL